MVSGGIPRPITRALMFCRASSSKLGRTCRYCTVLTPTRGKQTIIGETSTPKPWLDLAACLAKTYISTKKPREHTTRLKTLRNQICVTTGPKCPSRARKRARCFRVAGGPAQNHAETDKPRANSKEQTSIFRNEKRESFPKHRKIMQNTP